MNENCTSVNSHVCSEHSGGASRTLARVRERSDATVQCSIAGRREPPAVLRATAARAAARPPRPGHAHPPRTACSGHATLAPPPHHASCPRPASSHAPREIDVFCEEASCGDGRGGCHAPRGGPILRAASRICLDGFLLRAPQPAICRVARGARRARPA